MEHGGLSPRGGGDGSRLATGTPGQSREGAVVVYAKVHVRDPAVASRVDSAAMCGGVDDSDVR